MGGRERPRRPWTASVFGAPASHWLIEQHSSLSTCMNGTQRFGSMGTIEATVSATGGTIVARRYGTGGSSPSMGNWLKERSRFGPDNQWLDCAGPPAFRGRPRSRPLRNRACTFARRESRGYWRRKVQGARQTRHLRAAVPGSHKPGAQNDHRASVSGPQPPPAWEPLGGSDAADVITAILLWAELDSAANEALRLAPPISLATLVGGPPFRRRRQLSGFSRPST
jgi:hypothetical protein